MSSDILEFYIDKEKRELINIIGSAKYVSEEQKETMIGILSDDWAADRAGAARKASGEDPHSAGVAGAEKKRKQREREKEFQDKQKKRKEKMSQADQDWAADRAAAAQAAG